MAALQQLGVDAIGIDGVDLPLDLRAPQLEIRCADLRDRIRDGLVPPAYDLSLCLDVLEHLPEADAQRAIETITRGAQLLVLSCAPPGQGGHHHVNEQPRRHWIARLAAIGWSYSRRETGALESTFLSCREALPLSWMYHNLCVYRPTRRPDLLGQSTAGHAKTAK